ncbi:hypothetical protein LP419_32720 [Massilia sp. H-1]|nr:hypothetical protein LP419_32720 [Massilia sp. H-1]
MPRPRHNPSQGARHARPDRHVGSLARGVVRARPAVRRRVRGPDQSVRLGAASPRSAWCCTRCWRRWATTAPSPPRETLALFRDAHLTLVEGKGGLPGIFCGQLRDAYFGTLQGDRVIRQFIDLANATLEAITGDAKGALAPARRTGAQRDAAAERAQWPDPGVRGAG